MTDKTIPISTVAEEFAAGMEFFRQRALMRAAQMDELKAQIAAGQGQEGRPESAPPAETHPETSTGT